MSLFVPALGAAGAPGLCRKRMLFACLAAFFFPTAAGAKEDTASFLRALQNRGCGEEGIAYLGQLKQEGKLPPELAETFDLEMSLCYFHANSDPGQPAERNQQLAKTQEHLKKFFDEHPDHQRRADALVVACDLESERALHEFRKARLEPDNAKRLEKLAAARRMLTEARPKYADAAESFGKQFKAANEARVKQRHLRAIARNAKANAERLFVDWVEIRTKLAFVDYHIAETYPVPEQQADKEDPKDKPRRDAYLKAAKAFDEIHQENRVLNVGVYALLWYGKCLDELGDREQARDIYQEVLAFGPDNPNEAPTGIENILALANRFLLNPLRREDGAKQFTERAERWVKQFAPPAPGSRIQDTPLPQAWRMTEEYQGVCLDLAKEYSKQGDGRQKAVDLLQRIVDIPGERTAEAKELLKRLQ